MTKVLSSSDVEQFMELGWVRVPQAYSRQDALAVQDRLWTEVEKRGPQRATPSTWTDAMVNIRENYDDETFQKCNTDRLADAIEDLVGEGRWLGRGVPNRWGWWPVNFGSRSDEQWDVPTNGWHWDGIHFKHFVDSPDQGLLCLCIFSDIGPHGGGTLVVEGSHKVVARYLSRQKDGVDLGDGIRGVNETHEWFRKLVGFDDLDEMTPGATPRVGYFMDQTFTDETGVSLRVLETTAEAGDVFLCHPFLYHAASQNLSGQVRFMCNRTTPLRDRLDLCRTSENDFSPLEWSIRQAVLR